MLSPSLSKHKKKTLPGQEAFIFKDSQVLNHALQILSQVCWTGALRHKESPDKVL
jgi:hypothetical protein